MCDGVFGMALQEEKISIKDNPFLGVDSISSLGQIDESDSSKDPVDLNIDNEKDKELNLGSSSHAYLIRVSQLLETSNAARQGVKVGDCIVAIGERIVTGTRLSEFKKIIGSGGPRPSPLLIRFLPQNEAIDVLKTYVKDGVAGLMEFRMAILRDKKRSSLMRAGVKTMQNSIKSEHFAEHEWETPPIILLQNLC